MDKVAIIGFGYVGQAIFRFLSGKFKLSVVDPLYSSSGSWGPPFHEVIIIGGKCYPHIPEEGFADHILSVVCVPTNMLSDGSCDMSIVEDVVSKLKTGVILIKSTVIPGTTLELSQKYKKSLVFSPEFIGEGKYFVPYWKGYQDPLDMKKHQFFIFGGGRSDVCVDIWKRVAGWAPDYIQTDPTIAEIVKYAENAFLATRVAFFNTFYDICQIYSVDYNEFVQVLSYDKRIGKEMSVVNSNSRGYRSKCLDKDIPAIIKAVEKESNDEYHPMVLQAVLEYNELLGGGEEVGKRDKEA